VEVVVGWLFGMAERNVGGCLKWVLKIKTNAMIFLKDNFDIEN